MFNPPNPLLNDRFLASSPQTDPIGPQLETDWACCQAVFPLFGGIRADSALHMLRIPPARQAADANQVVRGKAQKHLAR
jgi:hypothetical protein